jgi:hypothetical protein
MSTSATGWSTWETPIPNAVLIDTRLTRSERLLYAILLARQGTNSHCWASQSRLLKDMGLKDRVHLHNLTDRLVAFGLLHVETSESRRGNRYRIQKPQRMGPAPPTDGSTPPPTAGSTPPFVAHTDGPTQPRKTDDRSRQ